MNIELEQISSIQKVLPLDTKTLVRHSHLLKYLHSLAA